MTAATSVSVGPRSVRRVSLSHTQRLILTGQQLHPGTPLANMGKLVRFDGPIDPDRLARAFDTVVRACDALRMTVDAGSVTTARILAEPPRRTEVVQLADASADDWAADRIETALDPTRCVYDSVVLGRPDGTWAWWLDLHHVAVDAWSSALVYAATALAYEHDDGDPDRLADVVDGRPFDRAPAGTDPARVDAWRDVVAEASGRPIAPYGSRGATTTRVSRLDVDADLGALVASLDDTYRSLSSELGLLAISAMAVAHAIRRLDGRRETVVGVPVHHRSGATRTLVAPLMEIYPVVVVADDDETPREQFKRTVRSLMQLLRTAKPGESPGGASEIVLNVVTAGYGDFAGVGTHVEWVRSGHVDAEHALRSQVFDYSGTGELTWQLDVNHGLATDGAWRRLPVHVGAAVDAIVAAPDRRWGDVGLVRSDEVAELAALGAEAEVVVERPVHEEIRERLRADGGWIVAEERGRELDAASFDRRAEAVARWLLRRGAGAGTRVGLRLRRSVDVLVAIHGVLRAGGAFVMLDPDDPVSRHAAIEADAELALVLDELPPDDRDYRGDGDAVLPDVGLDDLAYVLYTSGSTGAPKGVPISHRGLAGYLRFAVGAYTGDTPPVVALHSSLVFDLTVTSLFLSFLTHGRTVVFPDEPVTALGEIARDDRITLLKATPSQLELFTRLAAAPRPLATIVVGGEAFRRPLAERLTDLCDDGVRIFNEYGPTEAVVGCMIHEFDPALDTGPDVPIGRAAPGCELRILDELGHLAPTGAWGELWVRRDGMADGYLHLPDLSAERFVDLDGDGRRWYRTGDRVRVERPGVATYGGRADDQLKVRGIRLEPAEVEAALVAHPDVDGAVVRIWTPRLRREVRRCVRCGLGDDVPGTSFDADGVCNVCRAFDEIEPQTRAWFRTEADLDRRLEQIRSRHDGDVDALHLLSGGKDSTYALYQLVERGWRVHALTLDNGFISDGAKANIRASIADLGITHEFATTEAMNEIFRDSLERYSNVCQGCYKTIYTLAVARARELGIPVIVTGLSRGQFFETRLVPHQFEAGRFDPDAIDATVLEARRVYHHTRDAVTELLPEQAVFDDPDVFDRVEFLDFYRYVDVDLAELYRFLDERAPWVRPADTGRSTNCLINVAGISVHRREQGFHNYAEPYSWDVRLGHKTRDEALDELDDGIDDAEVADLLAEVGYAPKRTEVLTAWYTSRDGRDVDPDELRTHLRALLPDHAVPQAFVRLDAVPLAASAKVDVDALPAPSRVHRSGHGEVAPASPTEQRLCEIWAEVLGLERVGATDDFFDLGGASLAALEAVAAIDAAFGTDLHDAAVFRHRTVRELAAVVDRAAGDAPVSPTSVSPSGMSSSGSSIEPVAGAPLSAGEQAMLFDHRADGSRFHVARVYAVSGVELDLDRFEEAVRAVAMHHAPLHTSYGPDRRPLSPSEAVAFDVVPIRDGDDFARFAEVQNTVPFDLDRGPLVRVHVARTGADETSIMIGLHHISIDAGTFDTFWDQIAAHYDGEGLPALAFSYADHAAWQRSRGGPAAEFWRGRSARRVATRELGLAPPDPAASDGYLVRRIDLRASDLAVAGGTPFAAAMAAAAATVAALTADGTAEFRITVSTKDHPGTAPLVGYFLNTVPVQFDVDRTQPFGALVEAATAEVTETLPHRAFPFADIVRDARDAGFETPSMSFLLAYTPLVRPEFPGAEVSQRIVPAATAVADATLFVEERPDGLEVAIEHRGRVLDRDGAAHVLDVFAGVLTAGARAPDTPVGDLLPTGDDLDGAPLPPTGPTVLADVVARMADDRSATAVVGPDRSLSYGELAVRVASLADALAADGGVRRVGIEVRRSSDVVVAVLAAQFAGAAYVPLDPEVGRDRRDLVARSAAVDRTLTDADLAAHQAVGRGPDDAIASLRGRLPAITADSPAYVIFTSGSTGRPRGVEVSHGNLAASTAARSVWYAAPPRRFLLTSSIGFDSSVVGLFWTIVTGGAIVIPGDDEVHDVDRLGGVVAEHRVSHLLMVPSLYAALLRRRSGDLPGLDTAIVAGEACPAALVSEHHRLLPEVTLVNEYGPTEATVWATAHRLRPDELSVPIGGPIPGVTVRVADVDGFPVPVGVAGELLIAGPTVTAGYLDDDEATAARFVERDGRRWYRTGDRVRRRDRVLEFEGRLDDQLNVGGVRLEPGDVERILREIDGIREAVVVAAGSPPMLVAHLETDVDVDEAALRAELTRRLPPGAVPRRFVGRPALPRTPHGKLDRTAAAELPVDGARDRVEPSGRGVDLVIGVWSAALRRTDVGADSDFFALGGDSLAAVEIVTRLAELVGRDVGIGTLLAAPTPARLADAVGLADTGATTVHAARDEIRVVTLVDGPPTGPVVVLTSAWDDVFGYQALATAIGGDATVIAVAYDEQPGRALVTTVDGFLDAADDAVREAIAARRRIVVVGWSVGGVVAVALADRLRADGYPIEFVAAVDTYFPGEQRRLWSNRWGKYRSLLRVGAVGEIVRELGVMGGRRVRHLVGRLGRRLVAWSGGELPDEPARTSVGGFPVAALDHDVGRVRTPLVFYAADTTNPARTVVHWRRVADEIEVVTVEGRHRGFASVMAEDRVGQIAGDLRTRLAPD